MRQDKDEREREREKKSEMFGQIIARFTSWSIFIQVILDSILGTKPEGLLFDWG